MLSSAKRSAPTSKQFIQPYFLEIAPTGAITGTCSRFSAIVKKLHGLPFLGTSLLDAFALLGGQDPLFSAELCSWWKKGPFASIDVPIHRNGARSFTIRWTPTPILADGETEGGWQLTGVRVDARQDIILTTDLAGRVVYWNAAAEKFYGIPTSGAVGQPLNRLTRFEYGDVSEETIMQLLMEQEIWEGEATHVSGNGKKSYLICSIRYIRDSHQRVIGVRNLQRDITDKKRDQWGREEADGRFHLFTERINSIKKIAQSMVDAQEKERAAIGKELHDNINQQLSTTKLYLELARSNEQERVSLIERSAANIHQAIREIRKISRSLVPPSIEDLGLVDSVTDLVESLRLVTTARVEFFAKGNIDRQMNDKVKLALFRIIREQVNNVLQHADARTLIIGLVLAEADRRITLTVTDDGVGFDPDKVCRNGSGLGAIKSRTVFLGGEVTISSSPGQGCRLRVQFPVG